MATRITKKLVSLSGRCTRNIPQKTRVFSTSSSSFSSSDYVQTISHVPTMHFQPAIPQLPIPTLQDTCQRYLATQGAFLSQEEFEETKAIVEEFERGEGHELNIELVEQNKKNSHTSYITDSWLDMYLTYRASVVLNSNPVTLISDDSRPAYMQQILRATNITVSVLRFLKTLREGKLVPDVIHKNPAVTDTEEFWRSVGSMSAHEAYRHTVKSNAYPLDMSQFQRIFNATRIPQPIRDELFCDVTQRHVLVMCRGRMYVVDVLEEDGGIVSGQIIQAHLQFIFDDSASSPPQDHPVGFLTTQDRDTWTRLRQQIVELSKDNQDNMTLIDSALFCLCLEDDLSNDNVEDIKRGLYGNAGNRWFDKTIQLIVTKAGRLLINLEHSWGDGLTLKRVVTEAFQDSIDRPTVSPEGAISNVDHSQTVRKLEFSFDTVIHQGIEKAQLDHVHRTNQLNMQCMDYNKYGSTFLKECRLSPDAVAQLAMQIAYSRITGHTAATYESCSTALYKHGRTETIRSATSETKRCAEAFNGNTSVSLAEKVSLLKACSDKHRQLSAQATAGQGWDRHLFALRVLAMKSGKSIPRLFQDSAYANINTITLSTSTMGRNTASDGAAFAPVSPTGLGMAYSVGRDGMQWTGSSYKTSPNLSDFVECIQQASDEIHEVLKKP
ncbi:carnitine O-palmitoyltransferase 2, mitochondrial-like [Asterias rubens]|uniref:carnitine O-palmitoyltransferase 2, mitochondrial-like n=1 Tax=Asterias rubens TaxID=7604 RepID=UPI001454F4D7|nr:carnitine O-palmitoyltransferase 2, mitochondrial-like [Asterias rubens]XP_033644728.1 carnitine O-palmitoyltransferase 2, mitochondrial-like [Asterias rubens]